MLPQPLFDGRGRLNLEMHRNVGVARVEGVQHIRQQIRPRHMAGADPHRAPAALREVSHDVISLLHQGMDAARIMMQRLARFRQHQLPASRLALVGSDDERMRVLEGPPRVILVTDGMMHTPAARFYYEQLNTRKIGIVAILIAFASFAASAEPASSAAAPQPMTPDYEVKLFLDPSLVLDANHELTPALRNFFQTRAAEKIRVQFLDTNDQRINQEGWYVRLRKKENDASNKFEIVYKKRYLVENGNLNAALAQAARDGFTADDTNYEAQVDWGYAKQTLSISRKKKVKQDAFSGMALPDLPTTRSWAIDEAPGKFVNWSAPQWGVNRLQAVQKLYGP